LAWPAFGGIARTSRVLALVVGAVLSSATPHALTEPGQKPGAGGSETLTAFLQREAAWPPPNRAYRRLQASNRRFDKDAWLEAITQYQPGRGFTFDIVGQGGSSLILGKVLRPALEAEAKALRDNPRRTALSPENYAITEVAPGASDATGLVTLKLDPRRKEPFLVAGFVTVTSGEARVTRIEGRLAKNPSFWTTRVDVVRSYAVVQGFNMPVLLESKAEMRLVGTSEFRMTIRYESIAGKPVPPIDVQGVAGVGEAR
jgi:hypothetical protein